MFWISLYLLMTAPDVDPGELNEDEIARALAACGPDESSGSEKPVPALRREPKYPVDALRGGTEGYVLMSFLVGPDGRVSELQVDGSDPAGLFDEVSIRAVEQWRYCPRENSRSTRVRLDFTFDPTAGADEDPCDRLDVPFDDACRFLLEQLLDRRGRTDD